MKTSSSTKINEHDALVDSIKVALGRIEKLSLSRPATKKLREALRTVNLDLQHAVAALDPVKEPKKWFDPADSLTAGRLVAAALIAQPRISMDLVQPSYGAGVYAIYYNGDHPAYAAISGKETPIYVGKADPASGGATSPREQGAKLSARVLEHRKTIRRVEDYAANNELSGPLHPIYLKDFDCRRLVTASNAQMYAEKHLIDLFTPVWNSSSKICWGVSMHGDVTARENKRPPWHVLHPGVPWALRENIEDSRPAVAIMQSLEQHFINRPAYESSEHIIDLFLNEFVQDPMPALAPVGDDPAMTDE